jgi:hypothetical protein
MTTKTAEGKPAESVQSREQQQGHRFLRYSTECSDGASLNFMRARGRRPRPPQLQWTKTGEWPWPKRAATHRSWRAVRRPFLTVLHSSQPPVLGRSDQFRIMCRLLFRRSAVRRGGKVHFSNVRLQVTTITILRSALRQNKSGVGVSISGQPKTICRATNCRGCTTCPRSIQTCAHHSSDSRSTVKSIVNGPGVTA